MILSLFGSEKVKDKNNSVTKGQRQNELGVFQIGFYDIGIFSPAYFCFLLLYHLDY